MQPNIFDIAKLVQNKPTKDKLICEADAILQITTAHMKMAGYTMLPTGIILKHIFDVQGEEKADRLLALLQNNNEIAITTVLPKSIVNDRYDLASSAEDFDRWVKNHDYITEIEVVPLSYLYEQRLSILVNYGISIPSDFGTKSDQSM